MEEIGHKFRVSNVEGKGAGWIATKNIQRGELIWTESPILNPMGHFAFLGAINKAVNDLSKKNQKLFESLYDPEDGGEEAMKNVRIWNTNATGWGIYVTASRLNHSCQPNVIWSSDDDNPPHRLEVRALRDVSLGEELTVSYIKMSDLLPKEKRQQKLSQWGFVCCCTLCSLEEMQVKKNDEARIVVGLGIKKMDDFLDSLMMTMPQDLQIKFMMKLGLKCLKLVETDLAEDAGTATLMVLKSLAVLSALAQMYGVKVPGCENHRFYRDRAWEEAKLLGEMFLSNCKAMDFEIGQFV